MSQLELPEIFSVDREGKPTIKIVLFGPPMSGKKSSLNFELLIKSVRDRFCGTATHAPSTKALLSEPLR